MKSKWEKILSLSGEGGRICLAGRRLETNVWEFVLVSDESTLVDTIQDEKLESIRRSHVVSHWSEALQLLGRHWMRLSPKYVHPEFTERFLTEIENSDAKNMLHRWKRVCSKSPNQR